MMIEMLVRTMEAMVAGVSSLVYQPIACAGGGGRGEKEVVWAW